MVADRFDVQGKVAVVIGGAGYLCSTLASAMASAGMRVVIVDAAQPASLPPGVVACHSADVARKADLQRCCEAILEEHGRVDVLLNGAGTNAPTPFFEISDDEFHRVIDVNLLGTLHGCQVFGQPMVQQRSGSIINFASVAIGPPLSKAFVYSAAKAGVYNLTQNLGREWAPFNVRVNALRPGFFPTAWSMKHFIDDERKSSILHHTPMGRFGKPEELVGTVLWLASEASSFVTGSLVTVDGGFTAMTI